MLKQYLEKLEKHRVLSGLQDGEKLIFVQNFDRLIFLSGNFVNAGKIKRGLEALGKKVEIIATSRENDDDAEKRD